MPVSAAKLATKPAEAERSVLFASPQKRVFLLSLFLVVITLLLYAQTNHFSFLNFDDDMYVTENLHIRGGLSWSTFTWAMTSTEVGNWHPLTWLSHAADYQIFRLNPAGHHYVNLLLHACNVVLLFVLLARVSGRIGPSFLVAALFAVHPLNVESVAWISERKNLLSTTFFFLTLGAYGWYSIKPSWKRYLAVILLFACGLASKSMLVTLPFVLVLVDYWPLARIGASSVESKLNVARASLSTLVVEKLPLMVLSAADSLLTVIAQQKAGAVGSVMRFPFGVRLENAIYSYAEYVWKAFWPVHLANMYPHPGNSLSLWQAMLAAAFLLAITGLTIKLHSHRYLSVGWFFFLGTLVPVIGIVQVGSQAMADRYAYLPLLGIFVAVVWGAADVVNWKRINLKTWVIASSCVLLALSAVTYRQIGYWKDSLTLWTHDLALTENNFVAEDGLGGALVQEGRADEAYKHFQRAASIYPDDPLSHADIGAYLHQHGRIPEAIQQYETVLRLASTSRLRALVYGNMGSAYRRVGDYDHAKKSYDAALQLDPENVPCLMGLGLLAEKTGDWGSAIVYYSRAVAQQPTDVGFLLLARSFQKSGRPREAQSATEEAERVSGDMERARATAAEMAQ